ncbi:MAG: hypothetical protein KAS72_12730 [Phycisphaerales bacterium]|nr:hypothetical protein [Phycisphaerales bacterium]
MHKQPESESSGRDPIDDAADDEVPFRKAVAEQQAEIDAIKQVLGPQADLIKLARVPSAALHKLGAEVQALSKLAGLGPFGAASTAHVPPSPLRNLEADLAAEREAERVVRVRSDARILAEEQQRAGVLLQVEASERADDSPVVAVGETAEAAETLALDGDDVAILRALDKAGVLCTQPTIEADTRISRRSLGDRLRRLRDAGLTKRPKGPRGGEGITDKGRAALARYGK